MRCETQVEDCRITDHTVAQSMVETTPREDRRRRAWELRPGVWFRKTAKTDAQPPYRAVSDFELPERGGGWWCVRLETFKSKGINH